MSRHAEPVRAAAAPRSADRQGPAPAPAPGRCLGAAAQLAAVRRTLAGGLPLQLKAAAALPAGRRADAAADAKPSAQTANRTGLPDRVKAGVEALSGLAMDDVRVHRDSPEPARLGALAYTQGSDIHLGRGQEQHLPHEAWPAVQQRQGRVPATTRMKSVGSNDDAVLEAEADRMGAAAGSLSPPLASAPIEKAASGATVQRQIMSHHKWLEASPGYSPVTLEYIAKPEKYQMRDNYCPEDSPIQIIDMTKKYLLGEEHFSGKWEVEIDFWDVDKMSEARRVIPREAEEGSALLDEKEQPNNRPLESVHDDLFTNILEAHDLINYICSDQWAAALKKYPAAHQDIIDRILEDLRLAEDTVKWYTRFADGYEYYKLSSEEKLGEIYEFSIKFDSFYLRSLTRLGRLIKSLEFPAQKQDANDNIETVISNKSFEKAVNKIEKSSRFLPGMIKQLSSIIEISGAGEQDTLESLLPRSKKGHRNKKVRLLTNTIRERTMVENIRAASPPLLVQVGSGHIEGLDRELKKVDDTVIALEMDHWLREETEKPKS